MVVPADQRFTHWGSTPLLLLMGNVVYYVMGPSDRHIITSMSELYHMERAFQSNNKLCGGIQSPIRPSCTGPDPAIGLPMASLTYWTKPIDSSNRRVIFSCEDQRQKTGFSLHLANIKTISAKIST